MPQTIDQFIDDLKNPPIGMIGLKSRYNDCYMVMKDYQKDVHSLTTLDDLGLHSVSIENGDDLKTWNLWWNEHIESVLGYSDPSSFLLANGFHNPNDGPLKGDLTWIHHNEYNVFLDIGWDKTKYTSVLFYDGEEWLERKARRWAKVGYEVDDSTLTRNGIFRVNTTS
jgi:hypothetical protein